MEDSPLQEQKQTSLKNNISNSPNLTSLHAAMMWYENGMCRSEPEQATNVFHCDYATVYIGGG